MSPWFLQLQGEYAECVNKQQQLHIESNLDRLGLLSPIHGQSVFSATKRTNHAPIHSDLQAKVSQGHTSCRTMANSNTEGHNDGGLELVKPARESAFSRPKPCASLINAPWILPVRRSLLAPRRKKRWSEISFSVRNFPVHAFGSRA